MSLWFNPSSLSAYTLAKASAINSLMLSVQVAFDKLPDPAIIQQNRLGYCVDSGAANALVVGMPIPLTAYTAGANLRVKVLNSNTGPATINVDGLGAVAIKRADGSSLVGAELLAGAVVDMTYDGTVFRLPPVVVALTAGDIASITAGLAANYEPKITAGTSGQYWRGDKTFQTLNKAAVGLPNVDNTSDANKPISTPQQAAFDLKLDITAIGSYAALLAGATFTGSVGIGSAPAVKLHVNGAAVDEAIRCQADANPYISFYQGGATFVGEVQGTTTKLAIIANGARSVAFHTNGAERGRFDSSGKFMIGATSPLNSARATIVTADAENQLVLGGTTKGLRFSTNTTHANIDAVDATAGASYQPLSLNSSSFLVRTASVDRFTIDGSGNAMFNGQVNFAGDGNLYLSKSSGNPILSLDVNDFLYFDRTADTFTFAVGGVAKFYVDASGNAVFTGGVTAGGNSLASLASPTFTGTPAAPTAAPGTNTTQLATTAFVAALGALKANLASPALTGNPTAPTQASGDASTKLATTAFVDRLRDIPRVTGALARGSAFATAAGVTINNSGAAGETYSIYNDSAAAITITQGAGVTLRLGGTATTGNRTLAARAFATVWFNSTTEAIIMGAGVS